MLIFGYQLAQAAGVRESMSCASRDSGFAELCERFAGSQATEFMEQLGNLGNAGLVQRARGYSQADHRDRCRTVGQLSGVRLCAIWFGM